MPTIHPKSEVSGDILPANFLDVIGFSANFFGFSAKFRDFIRIFKKAIPATSLAFRMYGWRRNNFFGNTTREPSKKFVAFGTFVQSDERKLSVNFSSKSVVMLLVPPGGNFRAHCGTTSQFRIKEYQPAPQSQSESKSTNNHSDY